MKKIAIFAMAFLTVLMISMVPMRAQAAKGPRSTLDVIWYANTDSAFAALQGGSIDILQWALTQPQKLAVEADPNLQLAAYAENGIFEFDVNNEQYILDYPTTDSPTYNVDVRRALACLTDKNYIITNILNNYATRVDMMVCAPSFLGWVDPNWVTYDWNGNGIIEPSEDKYPYNYDITKAVDYLCDAGFSDTDGDGYLNYPASWPGIGNLADTKTQTMPLKIFIRNDDVQARLPAGRLLYAALEGDPAVAGDSGLALSPQWAVRGAVGGDFDTTDVTWEGPRAVCRPPVMGQFNYHVYTGGWSFGRFPTYVFTLFNSMFHYPYGPNYVCVDPAYDVINRAIYFASNLADSQQACKDATVYHVDNCVNIPLWSYTSYVAWSKGLAGVVNMKGYGIVNDWTFMNAYRAANPALPVRAGAVSGWTQLNALYSQWYFEYLYIDRVTQGLIAVNPYDLAADIPWGAQDWDQGTWIDPRDGIEKSTVTYYLRTDQGGIKPDGAGGGDFYGYYNARDYIWNFLYNYAYDDDWAWSSFMDINHIEMLDEFTVKVYFEDISMWFVYSPTYPLLGPWWHLEGMLATANSATFTGAQLVANGGQMEYQFTTDRIVRVTSATKNGNPIVEGVDYYIRAGYDTYTYNTFVAISAYAPADVIVVNYYYATPNGAGGLYVGGNLGYTWVDMPNYGYHYPISISTTSASLDRNPYFMHDVFLLGEVDYRWYYTSALKPRFGNFKIDILDVVKVTGAYCSRGDLLYNPAYLPGADLDATDLCHIGILDLVTITGKYAQTFGRAPDSGHKWIGAGTYALPGYSTGFVVVGSLNANVAGPTGGSITVTATGNPGFAAGYYYTATGAKEMWIVEWK